MSTHGTKTRHPRTPTGGGRSTPVPGQLELDIGGDGGARRLRRRPGRVPAEGVVTEPLDLGPAGVPVPRKRKPRGQKWAAFTATYEVVDDDGHVVRAGVVTEGEA